jgi:MFS family permease
MKLEIATAVLITLVVQTAISMVAACIPLLAPMIADARGWTTGLIAFYAPLVYCVGFAVNFAGPRLIAQFGGMGVNLICVASGAAGLACMLFDSLTICALSTLGIGVAVGMMNPASAQVLGPRTSPRNAGTIMAIKQTGVPLGGIVAGMVTPLLAVSYGWQWAVVAFIAGSVVLIAPLLPTVRWLNGDAKRSELRAVGQLEAMRSLLRSPGMSTLVAAGAMFSAALVCLRTFLAVYLVKDLGFSLAVAGAAFSASQIAGMIGQLGWAALSDRLLRPHRTMALIGLLIAAAAAAMAGFSARWPAVAVTAVVSTFGVGAAGFVPLLLGEVARRAEPAQVGAVTSAANLFLLGGVIVGPMAFGALATLYSYQLAFGALAGAILAVSTVAAARARTVAYESWPA